jgi:chloride channel protein, CIC family
VQGASKSPRAASVQSGDAAGFRLEFISLLAAGIGLLAGVIAYVLYNLIGLITNLAFYHQFSTQFRSPEANHLGGWVILLPVVGGLIVGFMAKFGSSKIKGHGIPEAMEAVLTSRSRIEAKVAILKPISAAIAIGTGGPFGAEGPIIQTGGAVGSLIGQFISTTASERKVLLACGAGAGMAATFNTPLAGVILAIELLLLEFRARSFIPLVISTTLATSVRILLLGSGAMFHFSGVDFGIPSGLPYYLVLGGMCGFAAIGLTKFLYWVEDLFDHLPMSDLWHPAIGALGLGIIGFFVPRVLGVGYDTISGILNNQFTLHVLIILLVFKILAMVISLGSGTSGGLLAPTFMSSAAMGGAFAIAVNHFIPSAHLSPGAYALVAMGAVFGAASRSTFAFIVFAFEITRDYNAILPLMLVCVIADIIAIRFLPNSIMTEKLARRGLDTHQDFEANVMRQVRVSEVMFSDVPTILPQMKVSEATDRIASGDPDLARHHALPIVDESGQLSGMVTQSDLLAMLELEGGRDKTVLEAGTRALVVCYPDENVFEAMTRMLRNDIGRLPVVSRDDSHHLIGYVSRSSVMSAWGRHLDDESLREHGWIKRYFKRTSDLPPGK